MAEVIKNNQLDGALSDEQLEGVAGGLSDRHAEEFRAGLGNKGLSERHAEEFKDGLGNKGIESNPTTVGETFAG
jgi:hypothetical protein